MASIGGVGGVPSVEPTVGQDDKPPVGASSSSSAGQPQIMGAPAPGLQWQQPMELLRYQLEQEYAQRTRNEEQIDLLKAELKFLKDRLDGHYQGTQSQPRWSMSATLNKWSSPTGPSDRRLTMSPEAVRSQHLGGRMFSTKVKPDVFDGRQFPMWKLKAAAKLHQAGIISMTTAGEITVNDRYGLYAYLIDSMTHPVMGMFMDVRFSEGEVLWNRLCAHYEPQSVAAKHDLRDKLAAIRQRPGEDITSYVGRINQIVDQLRGVGDKVDDDDVIYCIFRGVGPSFVHLVSSLRAIARTMSLAEVESALRAHEECLKSVRGGQSTGRALTVSDDDAASPSSVSSTSAQPRAAKRQLDKHRDPRYPQPSSAKRMRCYGCGKSGHKKSECRSRHLWRKADQGRSAGPQLKLGSGQSTTAARSGQAHAVSTEQAAESDSDGDYACPAEDIIPAVSGALDASDVSAASPSSSSSSLSDTRWLIDSGATSHYVCNPQLIYDVRRDGASRVRVANGVEEVVTTRGTARLSSPGSQDVTITDVGFVPSFRQNLISVGKLVDDGMHVLFRGDEVLVGRDDQFDAVGRRAGPGKPYYYYPTDEAMPVTSIKDTAEIMHRRAAHLSYSVLVQMARRELADGMSVGVRELSAHHRPRCPGCELGKHTRNPFADESHRVTATAPLDRIFCDVAGPINNRDDAAIDPYIDFRYVSVIVDEFTRFVSIKLLVAKSDASDHLREWIVASETRLNTKLKRFHSDGGGENTSTALQDWLIGRGVQIQITTPHTPQHNAIAERAIRTLFDAARSMLHGAGINADRYWPPAIEYAAEVINYRPHRYIKSETPYHLWYGVKPRMDRLRVFGCIAFVHRHKEDRNGKFDKRAVKGVFIGLDPVRENAYRVWIPEELRVIASRDVTFDELSSSQEPKDSVVDKPALTDHADGQVPVVSPDIDDIRPDINEVPAVKMKSSRRGRRPARGYINDDDALSDEQIQQLLSDWKVDDAAVAQHVEAEWSGEHAFVTLSEDEPATFKQAIKSSNAPKWREAMDKELAALEKLNCWDRVARPSGVNVIGSRWVFRIKRNADGSIDKFKARFVARGFTQVEGVDYNDVYAPVMRYKSLRIILVLACIFDMELSQMDIANAFINADIDGDVYVELPPGYDNDKASVVLKLKKALYGIKQAPALWHGTIVVFLLEYGWRRCTCDPCVFIYITRSKRYMLLGLFVDDIAGAYDKRDQAEWTLFHVAISKKYKLSDRGAVEWILGMSIQRDRSARKLIISQESFIKNIIARFGVTLAGRKIDTPSVVNHKLTKDMEPVTDEDIKFMSTVPYRAQVGCLMYLAAGTRPDIANAVHEASKFMVNPGRDHSAAVWRILKFVASTINNVLVYQAKDSMIMIEAFADADWAGNLDTRRSTTGWVVKLAGNSVSWASRKQSTVSLSSAESEYAATVSVAKEVRWLTQFIKEIVPDMNIKVFKQPTTPVIYSDSTSAIAIAKTDQHHDRTKHIEVWRHFIRDDIRQGRYTLVWVSTHEQIADALTKSIPSPAFTRFASRLLGWYSHAYSGPDQV